MKKSYDFCGWATRNDLKCADGRTIRSGAFKDNDGQTVPLVWNHQHDDAFNVLGHALLENRREGVYAYCSFNDTEAGQNAKELVKHGDIAALSIYANRLKQIGGDVVHGAIREVSLVLAGANPGAVIESVIAHSDGMEDEAVITTYTEDGVGLYHSADSDDEYEEEEDEPVAGRKYADTIEALDSMDEEQKDAMYELIGQVLEDHGVDLDEDDDDEEDYEDDDEYEDYEDYDDSEGGSDMKHNVFDAEENQGDVLTHSEMAAIISDAKRYGSLKDSVLAHGITDIDYLFPETKSLNTPPDWISRDMGWVSKVMNAVHHTPFSRIKSMFANITADEARAKGYVKGNLKVEEVFTLLKRTTTPQTIYKKQKLDRDDVIDITDFDVVAWLKTEMRMMLDEEIARAILIGDGRGSSDDDKINETNIRPIWTDADLYTVRKTVTGSDDAARAKNFIQTAIRARKEYKGSGDPTLFCTEDILTEMLLLEDLNQRVIYDSVDKLATALRVKTIVTVPVFENATRTSGSDTMAIDGIIVNLQDYNVGADKGGAVNMFDDFDIDYNQQKYLIETRCSGALIKPYSAIVLEHVSSSSSESEG